MDKKEHIDKLIDESINSIDNITRATPLPFLLTRINTRLNRTKESFWEKAVLFVGRPSVAIPSLVMLVFINVMVIIFNKTDRFTVAAEQSLQAPADEFPYAVATIYDIENTEP